MMLQVKAKVNRVQAAEGVCANCSRREQGGVSRACRVCNTTYCGSCKARFMTKSDAPGMRKRRRWICQSQQCQVWAPFCNLLPSSRVECSSQPNLQTDPLQSKDPDRHLIVGASHAAGKSPAKPAAFSRPSSKPSSSASAKATAARINKSSSGGGNAPGRKMSLGAAAGTPKCAVCSKTVYALEQEKAKGQVFHRSCFTCGGCQKSLSGGIACELYDGRLYCASARFEGASLPLFSIPPSLSQRPNRSPIALRPHSNSGAGQSCLSQAKRQSSGGGGPEVLKGAVAGRSMDIECDADIKAIIECLGSDLEKAIDGMIPRCETCGSTFTAKQVCCLMECFFQFLFFGVVSLFSTSMNKPFPSSIPFCPGHCHHGIHQEAQGVLQGRQADAQARHDGAASSAFCAGAAYTAPGCAGQGHDVLLCHRSGEERR